MTSPAFKRCRFPGKPAIQAPLASGARRISAQLLQGKKIEIKSPPGFDELFIYIVVGLFYCN